jgi:hypothetical protein
MSENSIQIILKFRLSGREGSLRFVDFLSFKVKCQT